MGGTMALVHSAIHPETVDRLTLLASPVNFHDEGVLSKWASKEAFDVDNVIDTIDHMDSLMLQTSFLFLKPLSYYQKMKNTYETCTDPKMFHSFVKLESWVNDNVSVPGKAYAEYVKLCYHENALMKRCFEVHHQTVDLRQVTCPILNIVATKDHIVPMESSRAVAKLVGSKVQDLIVDAGHIGVVMGRKARKMFESAAKFHSGDLNCIPCPDGGKPKA